MKRIIMLVVFGFAFHFVKSQDKQILGDTIFWYEWKKGLIQKFELSDFSKSTNEFDFRIWNHGQVLDEETDKYN